MHESCEGTKTIDDYTKATNITGIIHKNLDNYTSLLSSVYDNDEGEMIAK
jgi:hypothetical protein